MPDSMRKYLRPCLQQNPPSPLRPPGRLPLRICGGKTQNPNLSSRLGSCQPDRCAKSVAVVTARSRHATATGKRTAAASISSLSRSEEHTSELQSLMRISYAVFCLKKNKTKQKHHQRRDIGRHKMNPVNHERVYTNQLD